MSETKIEIITCPWCKAKMPIVDYGKHFDSCKKRLSHPFFKKPERTDLLIVSEEERVHKFLEKVVEEEKATRKDKGPVAPTIKVFGNLDEELIEDVVEAPTEESKAPVEEPEDRTFLIRNQTLVEVDGKVETPEEPIKEEIPEETPVEE